MEQPGRLRVVGGRYRLRHVVGSGGAGTVWLADDEMLERRVAVKELPWSPENRDEIRDRALVEARAAAALPDPGVVRVYDVVEEPSVVNLVLEFIDAPSLSDVVQVSGPLTDQRAAAVARDVLDTLAAAHAEGIVHRDVKPSNVLLAEHRPRLADFGIARFADDPHLTSTGLVLGTPAYMAPEQARGEDATPATDLYGLGATVYYAISGEAPFDGDGTVPTVLAVLHDPPRPLARSGPLVDLVHALMVKDPSQRPTAQETRLALTDVISAGVTAERVTTAFTAGDASERAPTASGDDAGAGEEDAAMTASDDETLAVGAASPLPGDADGTRQVRRSTAHGDAAPAPGAAGVDATGADDGAERARRPHGHRRLLVAAAVGVVAMLVALAAVAAAPGRDAVAEPSPSATSSEPVPDDWVVLAPQAAPYALAHPPDRTISSDEGRVEIADPATEVVIRVEWSPEVAPPLDVVRERSDELAARGTGYELVAILPTEVGDDEAATWEYEYVTDTGDRRHSLDLVVRHRDQYLLSLALRAPSGRWDEARPRWEPLVASLELSDLQ